MSQDSHEPRGTAGVAANGPPSQPAAVTPLLTVEQVAERLGTPTPFVRRLITQRRIGFCRISRYVRISA